MLNNVVVDGIEIKNVDERAEKSPNKYLVATYVDDEWWFYGIYPTMEKALEAVTDTNLKRCVFTWNK